MWKDRLFWLTQPEVLLNNYDKWFAWIFTGLVVLGFVVKFINWFIRYPVYKKLLNKYANLILTTGVLGVVWFGFRYENTPIFAERYWVIVIVVIAVIWKIFILKYLFTDFLVEKRSFDKQMLNSRYMPGKK